MSDQRLVERIEDLCHGNLSSKAFRERVLTVLRERVAFNAVNDHVKAILAKTGSRTRQMMLSRALGGG